MKLSLVTFAATAALAIFTSGCGTSDDKDEGGPKPQPTNEPPPEKAPRQLVDGKALFVVRTGTVGGYIHLAAPEVTSDELTVGQAVQSQAHLRLARARRKESSERIAIKAYQAIPPRLMPASPQRHLTD